MFKYQSSPRIVGKLKRKEEKEPLSESNFQKKMKEEMSKIYEALYAMESLDHRRLKGIFAEKNMESDDESSDSDDEVEVVSVSDSKKKAWIENLGEVNKEDWRVPQGNIPRRPSVIVDKKGILAVLLQPLEEFDTVLILNGSGDELTGKKAVVKSVSGQDDRHVTLDIEEIGLYGVKRRADEVRKVCGEYTYVEKPGKKGEYNLLIIDNDD